MKRAIIALLLVLILGMASFSRSAEGALITIAIEGVVDEVADGRGYLEGRIEVGDVITGRYSYDSATPDQDWLWGSASDTVGRYHYFSGPYGVAVSAGGLVFQSDPGNLSFVVGIVNDNQQGEDGYWIDSYNNAALFNGTLVGGISWLLSDPGGTVFFSDALPTNAPVLTEWQFNRLAITGSARNGFAVLGHITSAGAVPEPATVLLLGLGGLAFTRKR